MLPNIILQAVVGSQAYGLARENSDEDRLGVFVAPTLDLVGLEWSPKKETKVSTDPDITRHELGKFLKLSLKGNPTILELYWAEKYTIITYTGARIADLGKAVLSEKAVYNSYLGYARSQAKKLEQRGDSFSADTRKRTAKHARHMLRLIRQGRQLATEGMLTLKVPDPETYWEFDDMSTNEMLKVYERESALTEAAFEATVLPEYPDLKRVNKVLRDIRKDNL